MTRKKNSAIKIQMLTERKQRILCVLVRRFVATSKPVGSKTIREKYVFNLSAATIRNVMAQLEVDGYLTHIHTSSGRVPTDKSFRFYMKSLEEIQQSIVDQQQHLSYAYENNQKELNKILNQSTQMLNDVTNFINFHGE